MDFKGLTGSAGGTGLAACGGGAGGGALTVGAAGAGGGAGLGSDAGAGTGAGAGLYSGTGAGAGGGVVCLGATTQPVNKMSIKPTVVGFMEYRCMPVLETQRLLIGMNRNLTS